MATKKKLRPTARSYKKASKKPKTKRTETKTTSKKPRTMRRKTKGKEGRPKPHHTREEGRRIVEKRNLTSFANNTRWSTLLSELKPRGLRARMKHVASAEVSEWSNAGGWGVPVPTYVEISGPVPFRLIEWIDFDCAETDMAPEELLAAVAASKLTAEIVDRFVRVFGYR